MSKTSSQFDVGELRGAADWGDDAPLYLPRRDSIARYLIETWLQDNQ